MHGGAAFEQQRRSRRGRRAVACARRHRPSPRHDRRAAPAASSASHASRAAAMPLRRQYYHRARAQGREQARRWRRPQPAVEHDARQRPLAVDLAQPSAADRQRARSPTRPQSHRPRRGDTARAASRRAEVSCVRCPGAAAMRPSRLVAALRITNGRPSRMQREERLSSARRASSASSPTLDLDAVRAQIAKPAPAHQRIRDPPSPRRRARCRRR